MGQNADLTRMSFFGVGLGCFSLPSFEVSELWAIAKDGFWTSHGISFFCIHYQETASAFNISE